MRATLGTVQDRSNLGAASPDLGRFPADYGDECRREAGGFWFRTRTFKYYRKFGVKQPSGPIFILGFWYVYNVEVTI